MKTKYVETEDPSENAPVQPYDFVAFGRVGGLKGGRAGGLKGGSKGGKARAKKLSAKRRSEIASLAAKKRWAKKRPRRPVVLDDFLRD